MSGKKTDPTDDTNYFSSIKYGRDEGVGQDVHLDMSDAYANFLHYTISFEHMATQKTVHFKAFVKDYSESFSCNWTPTTVYGRTDPIQAYGGTTRRISLSFDVPASSVGEAYENMGRVSKLFMTIPMIIKWPLSPKKTNVAQTTRSCPTTGTFPNPGSTIVAIAKPIEFEIACPAIITAPITS